MNAPVEFTLTLRTDDAELSEHTAAGVARILREAAEQIEQGDLTRGACRDVNGNTVGVWRFSY